MNEDWRSINIVAWKRILKESIESNDTTREKYARWMLDTVLKADKPEERINPQPKLF